VPGLRQLADVVRRASGGQTRLLIQLIDFLAMRRRPERGKYFDRLLRITPQHRERLALADASEQQVRERLATLDDEALRTVLEPRELESYSVAIANALRTWSWSTSPAFPRRYRICLRTPLCEHNRRGWTVSSCTTHTRTPWRRFYPQPIVVAMAMAALARREFGCRWRSYLLYAASRVQTSP
jgi:hypothetical protein